MSTIFIWFLLHCGPVFSQLVANKLIYANGIDAMILVCTYPDDVQHYEIIIKHSYNGITHVDLPFQRLQLNGSSIQFVLYPVYRNNSGIYICTTKVSGKTLGYVPVEVGSKPTAPDFNCYTYHLMNLTCCFSPGRKEVQDNTGLPHASSNFSLNIRIDITKNLPVRHCPQRSMDDKCCYFGNQILGSVLEMTLEVSNVLGSDNISKTMDLVSIDRLEAPNATLTTVNSSTVKLTWHFDAMDIAGMDFLHKISCWSNFPIKHEPVDVYLKDVQSYNFSGWQPYSQVVCSIQSRHAELSPWGDKKYVTGFTNQQVPLGTPIVGPGFVFETSDALFKVFVQLPKISERYGIILRHEYRCLGSSKRSPTFTPIAATEIQITCPQTPTVEMIEIRSCNTVGCGPSVTVDIPRSAFNSSLSAPEVHIYRRTEIEYVVEWYLSDVIQSNETRSAYILQCLWDDHECKSWSYQNLSSSGAPVDVSLKNFSLSRFSVVVVQGSLKSVALPWISCSYNSNQSQSIISKSVFKDEEKCGDFLGNRHQYTMVLTRPDCTKVIAPVEQVKVCFNSTKYGVICKTEKAKYGNLTIVASFSLRIKTLYRRSITYTLANGVIIGPIYDNYKTCGGNFWWVILTGVLMVFLVIVIFMDRKRHSISKCFKAQFRPSKKGLDLCEYEIPSEPPVVFSNSTKPKVSQMGHSNESFRNIYGVVASTLPPTFSSLSPTNQDNSSFLNRVNTGYTDRPALPIAYDNIIRNN